MKPSAEKTPSGKVVWRVNYWVAKRRVRKTFKTREEARDWIVVNFGIADTEGQVFSQAWRSITPTERHELMDSLSLMRSHRQNCPKSELDLVQAATAQIAVAEAIQASILLRDAVDRFLATKLNRKRKGHVSTGWYTVLQSSLHRAVRELPVKTVEEYSMEEIEEYLDDQDWSPRTFNNNRNYIWSVFKFAVDEKYSKSNPVTKIEKFAKKFLTREVIVPAVPTIGRIMKLVGTKKFKHLRPAIDLGFGLAMRSSEISETLWENVTEALVHVPASVAKSGQARNIARRPLLDGIFRSLLAQKTTGLVVPKGWRRDLTTLFEAAGLGKPRNIMRKSGGSYHYHATNDESLTQDMMGHTEDSNMFGASYKALNFADVGKKTPIATQDGVLYYNLWKS